MHYVEPATAIRLMQLDAWTRSVRIEEIVYGLMTKEELHENS